MPASAGWNSTALTLTLTRCRLAVAPLRGASSEASSRSRSTRCRMMAGRQSTSCARGSKSSACRSRVSVGASWRATRASAQACETTCAPAARPWLWPESVAAAHLPLSPSLCHRATQGATASRRRQPARRPWCRPFTVGGICTVGRSRDQPWSRAAGAATWRRWIRWRGALARDAVESGRPPTRRLCRPRL